VSQGFDPYRERSSRNTWGFQSRCGTIEVYIGRWLISNMTIALAARALANERRIEILEWLKNPTSHFRPQVDGDLVEDGVCGLLIAEKLGVSQPTASEHLKILTQAGLLQTKRIKQWTFYKRDERRINALKALITKNL
jgi:DNA-binding transcriptional ArsR family regulator